MRTLRLFSFLALFFLAYGSAFAETATDEHTDHTKVSWSGLYLGFIPCADCKGVKTTLALNNNDTYVLLTQFVGKSDREIVEKGKFTWDSENNVIILTSRKGDSTRQYFVDGSDLIQLDNQGHRITGEEAERYKLRKTNVTQQHSEPSHGGHAK